MGCSGAGRSLFTSEQQARLLFSDDLVTGPVLEMDAAQVDTTLLGLVSSFTPPWSVVIADLMVPLIIQSRGVFDVTLI